MPFESEVIDSIDARILRVLVDQGRISWRELGDHVHLSSTSVADRVRRLEERGVIIGYAARVSPDAISTSVRAVIDVSLAPGDTADSFEARLRTRSEVVHAAYVTGSADYSVLVECSGPGGLDAFVRWLRADEAVARTESKLMLREVAGRAALSDRLPSALA